MSKKNIFIDGAISPSFISESIGKHSAKKNIGAHSIFLGQVRDDVIDGKKVTAIDYSCYREMAENKIDEIRKTAFEKFSLMCLHIHHSLGKVYTGEISLFVFTSSIHRKDSIDSCEYLVNRIKNEVPIWGKECYDEGDYKWKINS
jgi:molybdopterin synthase catalytic subunit